MNGIQNLRDRGAGFYKKEQARGIKSNHIKRHLPKQSSSKEWGRAKAHHINVLLRDAEAALQAVKEWAQVTQDSIGDAVVTTDLVCRVTYMNRVAERLTGWSSVNALGKPLAQVLMLVDGKTLLTATNPAQRVMEENRTVGLAMDCLLIRPDGS